MTNLRAAHAQDVSKVSRTVLLAGLSRAELFAGLSILGFANGIVGRARAMIVDNGLATALFNTFDISAIAWVAFYTCPALMLRAPKEAPSRGDRVVVACLVVAFMLPVSSGLSWIALTGLAFYLLRDTFTLRGSQPPSFLHRGAWVLLATTGAMFWGRTLLFAASDLVLQADAILVGWFAQASRTGNTVQLADGTGHLWIAPACSSLVNLSLAVLCWVLFMQSRGVQWSFGRAKWCLLACSAVIGINVTRIGMMVLHPGQYELIHGPVGAAAASWLTVAVTVAVCAYGTRPDSLRHA